MGDTPPVLLAVDPDILLDVSGFQGVAFAYAQLLRRAPAILLITPSEDLCNLARNQEFPSQELVHRAGALHTAPDGPLPDCPEGTHARTWLDVAISQIMQAHVQAQGLAIPIVKIPLRNAASIVTGDVHDAVAWAQTIGANRIEIWSPHDYVDPTLEAAAAGANVRIRILDPRPEAGVQVVN